jgi:hypothetical protein
VSIRETIPRSDIAVQIDPSPAVIASGEPASAAEARTRPVEAEKAPTSFPPSVSSGSSVSGDG